MNVWQQNYDPLGIPWLSTLAAALPVVALLAAIALFEVRIHRAALIGLVVALAVACGVFRMPLASTAAAAGFGAAYGLFPIGWMILNVMFLYDLTVRRGHFAAVRDSLATLAPDARVQLVLIAFSFGAFLEGMAGFGAPVAITGAILVQLGFKPLHAACLALIANTAPVAFGSLGIPIATLAQVTGIDVHLLSAMAGRQMFPFSILIPFWVVAAFGGLRAALGVWPVALTAGIGLAVPQLLISNLHGPWLSSVVSGACSIGAVVLTLRVWQPKERWDVNGAPVADPGQRPGPAAEAGAASGGDPGAVAGSAREPNPISSLPIVSGATSGPPNTEGTVSGAAAPSAQTPFRTRSRREVIRAWIPWVVLTAFILVWGLPQTKTALDGVAAPHLPMPGLHLLVRRGPPVADAGARPEAAEIVLNGLSATGSAILASALLSGLVMGFPAREMLAIYAQTLRKVRFSLLTIAAMLAIGNVTRYSGTDATLGLALARTGGAYPFFGTLLGWLGVALTGSDTASNVLFGSLQKVTAHQVGVSPVVMCAANSTGGVMGKMIDAQSIVVASTSTGGFGRESAILRRVFFHSLVLAVLMAAWVYLLARVAPFTHLAGSRLAG